MKGKLMYKIYIDTTERYTKEVSLLKKDGEEYTKLDSIVGDIDVVSSIEEILKKNNIKTSEVDIVEPNTGPGSFTGIKNGIAIANTANWALEKKDEGFKPNYGAEPNISKSKKF